MFTYIAMEPGFNVQKTRSDPLLLMFSFLLYVSILLKQMSRKKVIRVVRTSKAIKQWLATLGLSIKMNCAKGIVSWVIDNAEIPILKQYLKIIELYMQAEKDRFYLNSFNGPFPPYDNFISDIDRGWEPCHMPSCSLIVYLDDFLKTAIRF